MNWLISLKTLNLIRVFDYYLILAVVVGTIIHVRNFRAILGVLFTFSHRWAKLLVLAKKHRLVFLRWPMMLPLGLMLALMVVNFVASRFIWSEAEVTFDDIKELWFALSAVMISGALMLFLDYNAIFGFGRFNRAALEENLDKAEHWLSSWRAPAIGVVTLGLINPRNAVNTQVLEALVAASLLVSGQMWRWAVQIGKRGAWHYG